MSEQEQCERCKATSKETKHYFIHPDDDHNEAYLCNDCASGLWSYLSGMEIRQGQCNHEDVDVLEVLHAEKCNVCKQIIKVY